MLVNERRRRLLKPPRFQPSDPCPNPPANAISDAGRPRCEPRTRPPKCDRPPLFLNTVSFFVFSQEDEQLSAYVRSVIVSNSNVNIIGLEDDTGRVKAPVKAFVTIGTHLHRTAKQCRERWKNFLRDGIKKGDWTPQEEELIRDLYLTFGSRCVLTTMKREKKHQFRFFPPIISRFQSQLEFHGQTAPEPVGQ
jgi:Myb-like DNA-binding domain